MSIGFVFRIDNPFVSMGVFWRRTEWRFCVRLERDGEVDEVMVCSCAVEACDFGQFQVSPMIEMVQKMHGVMVNSNVDETCFTLYWVEREHILRVEVSSSVGLVMILAMTQS